jgi:hypothetical protein
MTNTTQFRALTTQSGKRAFEAYCAVWTDCTVEMALCAATFEALKNKWADIFPNLALDESRVQHVFIVAASEEAPTVKDARGAEVKCQFCGRQASFIIRKIAVCERIECKEKVT